MTEMSAKTFFFYKNISLLREKLQNVFIEDADVN